MESNKNNKFSKEEIFEMKNLSLLIMGYDVWIYLSYNNLSYPKDLKLYVINNSKFLTELNTISVQIYKTIIHL